MRWLAALSCAVLLSSCARSTPPLAAETKAAVPLPDNPDKQPQTQREIRLTGLVEAVNSARVVAPQIVGQNNRMTLTRLIPNGARVEKGDIIAEFDPLEQMDAVRTSRAKYEDLTHQVEQKAAQNRADQEKRRSDLRQAEADLNKAMLEVAKAEILADIAKQQNNIKAERGRQQVASLTKSHGFREKADLAALRVLELQRDRQKVAMERAQGNIDIMQVKAPISGMVAHSIQYRNGSMTHAQEGDQFYRGNPLVSIFDPTEMLVRCSVGEPDRVVLDAGTKAVVYLDAYPGTAFPAHFVSASPIATTALGSPIKTFSAVFKIDQIDARVVPDLSAAVVIETNPGARR